METDITIFTVVGLRLVSAVLILVAGWTAGKWASRAIMKIQKLDGTLRSFLAGCARYTILAVAAVTVLGQFGVQTASLIAVLGAMGLAVGLALQGTLSNVAAGVMLLFLRPFNVGDEILAGGQRASVVDLGLFATELRTAEGVFIFAPNSTLWNTQIQNFTRTAAKAPATLKEAASG